MRQGQQAAEERADAARKRAAVEMVARHGDALKRTARRFSLDAEDAEDAYQRALEIVLTKAPTTDMRELIRWTQTVTKHEALAVRQSREKLLGPRRQPGREGMPEPLALVPAATDGPDEEVVRREEIARSREALRALKPAERRALTLLAEGYSYAEIGARTGFSRTKVNRLLTEGRDRFRRVLAGGEDGSRCRELGPLLSAFCDGEASERDAATVREHLRACGRCRSTARAYRATPRLVAGIAPLLPPSRSLLGRAHDALSGLAAKLPGIGGGEAAATQAAAAGGSSGAGLAAAVKLLAICAGAAGGAAACATGVLPAPQSLTPDQARAPAIERIAPAVVGSEAETGTGSEPVSPAQASPPPAPSPKEEKPEAESPEPVEAPAGAVEYEAPPPVEAPASEAGATGGGSAAGEFGP